MRIGIDIMGGDFAPEATIVGSIAAQKETPPEVEIVLLGQEKKIHEILEKQGENIEDYHIVHIPQVIGMGEHPANAFVKKPKSSIGAGFKMLATGEIQAFASAGNTGAVLVGAMHTLKTIPGIIRPCISTILPREDGTYSIIMDIGINPDCRPEILYQYAILGSLYAESIHNIENPKVGLMNIGAEAEKGNLLTKSAYELMHDSKDFNFTGNIEGDNLFEDKADVIICDGFTGNIILKVVEGLYSLMKKRNCTDNYFEKFNFENYGGTPILGINGTVMIGHGISNPAAIKSMIRQAESVVKANLSEQIKETFNKWIKQKPQ